jgi:hypothetical protein
MSPIARRLVAAGATLALAAPAPALAHDHHHHHHHGFGRFGAPCRALEAGKTPRHVTADQAAALKSACATRDAAVKAANAAFKTATAGPLATYKAAVAPAKASVKDAWTNLRTQCKADRSSQACADARTAYRSAVEKARPVFASAWTAYLTATRPAAQTRNAAIRDAQKNFRAAVAKALAS